MFRSIPLFCLVIGVSILSQPRAHGQWTQQGMIFSPPARAFHCGAYDDVNDTWLVHGGNVNGNIQSDTWIWRMSGLPAWTQVSANNSPALHNCGATFVRNNQSGQPVNRVLMLHGISNFTQDPSCIGSCNVAIARSINLASANPTWVNVTQIGTAPVARNLPGLTYNPTNGKILFMGGNGQGPTGNLTPGSAQGTALFIGDLSSSGGTLSWSMQQPSPSGVSPGHIDNPILQWIPSARHTNGLVILSGGRAAGSGSLFATSTYAWDGSTDTAGRPIWTLVSNYLNAGVPGVGVGYTYDGNTGYLTRFGGWHGGSSVSADTRVLDLDAPTLTGSVDPWKDRSSAGSGAPTAREQFSMIYRPIDRTIYIFGGKNGNGSFFDQTWKYNVAAASTAVIAQSCGTLNGTDTLQLTNSPAALNEIGRNEASFSSTLNFKVFATGNAFPLGGLALLAGVSDPNIPFGGCTIHSSGDANLVLVLNSNSTATTSFAIPDYSLSLLGLQFFWQAGTLNSTGGVVTSPALRTTVGY
ncbi:MAG: Kelch repeat-containing protein [Oligoflexia bacterium]|jgi:hypothetical protein